MKKESGYKLIDELFSDPVAFSEKGKADNLLGLYLKGFDLRTLADILKSENQYIQSVGTYVASEMGSLAYPIVDELIPLLKSEDPYIKDESLETIFVCAFGEKANRFVLVIEMMEDNDSVFRQTAMKLVSKYYEDTQIKEAIEYFKLPASLNNSHIKGLNYLLNHDFVDTLTIIDLINSEESLLKKYGCIIAKKNNLRFSDISKLIVLNDDIDSIEFINKFFAE